MAKPAKLTAKHYKGIGEVVYEWAKLEYMTVRALATLLDTGLVNSVAVFWHMSFKERKARLTNLICVVQEDENSAIRKDFDTLGKRLDTAESIRNTVAHSVWKTNGKKGVIIPIVISVKGGPMKITGRNIKDDEFTSERLKGEAAKIRRLFEDFKHFFKTYYPDTFLNEKDMSN
jgi:hypothetical protein